MSTVEVQVAAAEGCACDFQHGVCGLLDLGVRAVFYGNLEKALAPRLKRSQWLSANAEGEFTS